MSKKFCKNCGDGESCNHDRCNCCGCCRKCGQSLSAPPPVYIPVPVYPQPQPIPYINPYPITGGDASNILHDGHTVTVHN